MTSEDIILRHSNRGMNLLRAHLPANFCTIAANKLLGLTRGNILLTTGFYVAGHAETDGPPGTLVLAKALSALGFSPVIVTDALCRNFFDHTGLPVLYLEKGFDAKKILDCFIPEALISIERCGENINGDYANMRGVSIADFTTEIDALFDAAMQRGIYTIGIGDGGNEIGMGNLQQIICEKLSLVPCKTKVTDLIIATVSNWGAYALAAELSVATGQDLLLPYEKIADYIAFIVSKGSVDGVKKEPIATVDSFPAEIEREITEALHERIREAIIK